MLNKSDLVTALWQLGVLIKSGLDTPEIEDVIIRSINKNSWFTRDNIRFSLLALASSLEKEKVDNWISHYPFAYNEPRRIGVIAAGNIPAVGFHDLISVVASGNICLFKPSDKDDVLMFYLVELLLIAEPRLKKRVEFVTMLKNFDAVIATGSNNTSRYFEYYFKDKISLMRKSKTSVAVLYGNETKEDYINLGWDIFRYFGLGCRNVTKLFVPVDFNWDKFFQGIAPFNFVGNHHKYFNNYEYNLAISLINNNIQYSNEFLVLHREPVKLFSPVGELYFMEYQNEQELEDLILSSAQDLQCVVTKTGGFMGSLPFGTTQTPGLFDYPDGADIMDFLLKINFNTTLSN